ncbi:MAG: hypothetical protein H0U70_05335 [Tatlockia sp.]|nr:hypothetical protein [Tatlockia sp.]
MLSKNDNSSNAISYLNGLIDPQAIALEFPDLIQKFIEGNHKGLNFEKLKGHNIYSVRGSLKRRLLYTRQIINGQSRLILLEVVENHYRNSRFLKKPSVLNHYLELNGQAFSDLIGAEHFEKTEAPTLLIQDEKQHNNFNYYPVEYFNHNFFSLDQSQQQILQHKGKFLVVSGPPGSGKSSIIVCLFVQWFKSMRGKLLLVTQEQGLADFFQVTIDALPNTQEIDRDQVQIKSYAQLIKDLDPESRKRTFVGKEDCINWLENYYKRFKKNNAIISKEKILSDAFDANPHNLYKEFRIISGCANFKDYKERGQKQSYYTAENEKKWLFDAYQDYQETNRRNNKIHTPFYPLNLSKQYSHIAVDEGQDLSPLELKILTELAEEKICICENHQQSLCDAKSKIPFLNSLMHSFNEKDNHHKLQRSYRCKEAPLVVVNTLSELKAWVTGEGQLDISAFPSNDKGLVSWVDKEERLKQIIKQFLSQDFAIVTSEHYIKEVKALVGLDYEHLVYSVKQSKGLEFESVLTYRILEQELFYEADKLIAKKPVNVSKKSENHAKPGQGNDKFSPIFSEAFTAFTRALVNLYIYQPINHQLQHLTKALKAAIGKEQTEIAAVINEEQIFNRVKELLTRGDKIRAEALYKTLQTKTQDFETIFRLFYIPPINQEIVEINSKSITQQVSRQTLNKSSKPTAVLTTSRPKNTKFAKLVEQKDRKTKEYEFINNLVDVPTINNLEIFLKVKKAKDFLFNYPLQDGACAYTQLFYTLEGRKSLFYLMVLPEYQDIFSALTKDALSRARVAPYYQIHFNNRYPDAELPKGLARENKKALADYVNCSPLYWLAENSETQKIFYYLLGRNLTKISHSIDLNALYLARPLEAGKNAHRSPFLSFSLTRIGREILKMLFEANPNLVTNVNFEILTVGLIDDDRSNPLLNLLFCNDGLIILKILFAHNPKLSAAMTPKILFAPLEAHSMFLYFACNLLGVEILKIIFSNKPELMSAMTAEILGQQIRGGEYPNASTLYFLSTSPSGLEIIEMLQNANPNLYKSISAEILLAPLNTDRIESSLYWLSSSSKGLAILKQMLHLNPQLSKAITIADLTRKRDFSSGDYGNTCVLSLLSISSDGNEILNFLLKNASPEVAQFLKPKINVSNEIMSPYPGVFYRSPSLTDNAQPESQVELKF